MCEHGVTERSPSAPQATKPCVAPAPPACGERGTRPRRAVPSLQPPSPCAPHACTDVPGFRLIFYKQVQLTLDIGWAAWRRLRATRPNLIHAVTPGFFVVPAGWMGLGPIQPTEMQEFTAYVITKHV